MRQELPHKCEGLSLQVVSELDSQEQGEIVGKVLVYLCIDSFVTQKWLEFLQAFSMTVEVKSTIMIKTSTQSLTSILPPHASTNQIDIPETI